MQVAEWRRSPPINDSFITKPRKDVHNIHCNNIRLYVHPPVNLRRRTACVVPLHWREYKDAGGRIEWHLAERWWKMEYHIHKYVLSSVHSHDNYNGFVFSYL